MTVDEMLDRMSSFELTCWKALWKLRAQEAKARSGTSSSPGGRWNTMAR